MSRVAYARENKNGLQVMHRVIIKTLNQIIQALTLQHSIPLSSVYDVTLVGNTTMTHILMGINPSQLGVSPFALATRDAIDEKAR